MAATKNDYIRSAIESLYLTTDDEVISRAIRNREDFLARQAKKDAKMQKQAEVIRDQASEITRLRALLAANNIEVD